MNVSDAVGGDTSSQVRILSTGRSQVTLTGDKSVLHGSFEPRNRKSFSLKNRFQLGVDESLDSLVGGMSIEG